MRRQLLNRALRIVFGLAVLGFLALFIRHNWERVAEAELTFHPASLVPAVLLLVAFYVLYSHTWEWLLARLDDGPAIDGKTLLRIFVYSLLARYLPAGKLWNVGTRIELCRRETGRRAPAVASLYFEQIYFVGGAVVLMLASAAASLPGPLAGGSTALRILSAVAALLLVAVLLAAPSRLLSVAGRLVRSRIIDEQDLVLSGSDRARAFVRFLLVNAAQGAAAWFALLAVYPPLTDRPDLLLPVLAAYPFSRFLGQLATVAPGGLGVREGAFTFLLSGSVPVQATLVAGAAIRLVAVLLEVGFLLALHVPGRKRPGGSTRGGKAGAQTEN